MVKHLKLIIKKIIPPWFLRRYRAYNVSKFSNKSPKDVFTEIYNTNYWKSSESLSGGGSEIKQTKSLVKDLEKLFISRKVTTLLDIPCGDFNWMKNLDLTGINYTGADIVVELIESNKKNFGDKVSFRVLNLINDPIEEYDLIFCRDCLVHLSYSDISKALKNIRKSNSKYFLTTSYSENRVNYDIITGDWRPICLLNSPFNFSPPKEIIIENSTEGEGRFKDKSLMLWSIEDIPFAEIT